jgi:hypothetical protein
VRVIKRIMLVALLLTMTTGCAATFWAGNQSTTFRVGMTKQQAQAMFGQPQQVMTQDLQGMMVETWKYLDRTLTFRNGLLYSWVSHPVGNSL